MKMKLKYIYSSIRFPFKEIVNPYTEVSLTCSISHMMYETSDGMPNISLLISRQN